MTARRKHMAATVSVLALALWPAKSALADSQAPPSLLFHPSGPPPGKVAFGLGLMLDVPAYSSQGFLPVLPQIEARLRYGLPKGFALTADLQTIFIINDLTAGVSWGTTLPEVASMSIRFKVAAGALFGGLSGFGFDTFLVSPLLVPSVSIGGSTESGIHWTLREEVLLNRWQYAMNGGAWAETEQPAGFTGSATLLTLENPLSRGGNLYFGGGIMVARASYSLWIPFSQQTALIVYPRVMGGYVF